MELGDIINFSKEQGEYYAKEHNIKEHDKKVAVHISKLMEESGEMAEAALASLGFQRPHKIDNFKKEDLEDEIADVILQAFIIADTVDADILTSLKRKITKAIERRN